MEEEDEILTPAERKKKLEAKERKKAKKDIEGKKSSLLTFKDKAKKED